MDCVSNQEKAVAKRFSISAAFFGYRSIRGIRLVDVNRFWVVEQIANPGVCCIDLVSS